MKADTIAAIATALSDAGIGIIRISGPVAIAGAIRVVVNKKKEHTLKNWQTLTIHYGFVEENGKEKGVYAKMARGAMVRYLAENQIENIKDITQFSDLGYTFDASQSTEKNYIFKKKLSS